MCAQAFAVSKSGYDRTQLLQSFLGDLLRSDVLLERLGVNTAELACVTVCRKGVVRARCIVTTAERDVSRRIG